jgi:hypothetical protein
VVVVNSRQSKSSRRLVAFSTQSILTAGILIGASLLAACGDSDSAKARKAALTASDDARKSLVKAGEAPADKALAATKIEIETDARESDKKIKASAEKLLGPVDSSTLRPTRPDGSWGKILPMSKEEEDSLREIRGMTPADAKEYSAAKLETVRKFIALDAARSEADNTRALADLENARKLLDAASKIPEISKAMESTVKCQLGATTLTKGQLKLQEATMRLTELTSKATMARAIAIEIQALDKVAKSLETKSDTKKIEDTVAANRAAATKAEADLSAAQGALKALQDQKTALEGDASALEKKADEQAAAAHLMKQNTKELRKAYNDARAAAKQTFEDALAKREQIAILVPQITAADLAVKLAEDDKAVADASVKAFESAQTGTGRTTTDNADRAKLIRARITALTEGWEDQSDKKGKKQPGLIELNAAVIDAGKALDAAVADAVKLAEDAQKAFNGAGIAAEAQATKVNQMLTDKVIENNDPLVAATGTYYRLTPKLLECIAYYTKGEMQLVSIASTRVRNDLSKDADAALAIAGKPANTGLKVTNPIPATDARTSFGAAIDNLAKNVENKEKPLNWLALAVKASALQGRAAAAEPGSTEAADDTKLAIAAAESARKANPTLEFPGLLDPYTIVMAPAVDAGKGPDGTGPDVPVPTPAPATGPATGTAPPDNTAPPTN